MATRTPTPASGDTSKKAGEQPKYRVLEKCYLDDKLHDPDLQPFDPNSETGERRPLIITFAGCPGHFLQPMNDAARAQFKKHKISDNLKDPIEALTIVGAGARDIKDVLATAKD